MELSKAELESRAIELSSEAFNRFCEDISCMFGIDMSCTRLEVCDESIQGLKKRFRKLTAIDNVKTNGAMEGVFHLIFDQGGLFILSGTIVMMPEKRILEEIKRGSIQDVQSMNDAIAEVGNLCVGSWDRIFREEYEGHGHFVQDGTFIGNPWDNTKENIGMSNEQELTLVLFEMTVGSFPTFNCGVIFPKNIFASESETVIEETSSEQTQVENDDETVPENNDVSKPEPVEYKKTEEIETVSEAKDEPGQVDESVIEPETTGMDTSNEIHTETQENTTPQASQGDSISETIRKLTNSQSTMFDINTHKFLSSEAKEFMDKNIIWCNQDTSVQSAIEKMQQHDTGYLLIGSDTELEGIVSRSDISGALSPYLRNTFAKWRRPLDDATLQIKVKWIMSRPVRVTKSDATLNNIISNMLQYANRCLPVMNNEGKIEGIITIFDVLKVLSENLNITTVGRTAQPPMFFKN